MSNSDCCAKCEHFSGKGYPEHAARGEGHCSAPHQPPATFVRWDSRGCVLYGEAKDIGTRIAWMRKQGAASGSDSPAA